VLDLLAGLHMTHRILVRLPHLARRISYYIVVFLAIRRLMILPSGSPLVYEEGGCEGRDIQPTFLQVRVNPESTLFHFVDDDYHKCVMNLLYNSAILKQYQHREDY
jgi:hypothetical protein